jgi:putative Mg2+ transporter-C (MgtC) family protein
MYPDWQIEIESCLRAIIATLLGAVVGWERSRDRADAGVRTYAAVSLGACMFALVGGHSGDARDRIAAQVVSGLGFLGAGVILRDRAHVRGLTTAATLWATASIGMAVAYGRFVLAVLATGVMVALLSAHHLPGWHRLMRHSNDLPGTEDGEEADSAAKCDTDQKGPL